MKIKGNKLFLFLLIISVFSYSFSDNKTPTTEDTSTTNNTATEEPTNTTETSTPTQESTPKESAPKENTTNIRRTGVVSPKTERNKKSRATSSFKKKEINNSFWRLVSILDTDLTTEEASEGGKTIITLYLSSKGSINGVIGDEGYFGNYSLDGNNISISLIGDSTLEGKNQIENDYLDAIKKVRRIDINGNTLTLRTSAGNLVFERVK